MRTYYIGLAVLRHMSNAPNRVEQRETHLSHVFLAGPLVYKLKKPVKYDFLDFSTLPAREHACREEIRFNRRLAPHVYLGVVPVTWEDDGSFALGGRGEIVDWLVQMRVTRMRMHPDSRKPLRRQSAST